VYNLSAISSDSNIENQKGNKTPSASKSAQVSFMPLTLVGELLAVVL